MPQPRATTGNASARRASGRPSASETPQLEHRPRRRDNRPSAAKRPAAIRTRRVTLAARRGTSQPTAQAVSRAASCRARSSAASPGPRCLVRHFCCTTSSAMCWSGLRQRLRLCLERLQLVVLEETAHAVEGHGDQPDLVELVVHDPRVPARGEREVSCRARSRDRVARTRPSRRAYPPGAPAASSSSGAPSG